MRNKRNYYRLLHVQFDAPNAVIKSSYRSMMQKLRMHPDLGGDEDYAKLLNEAMSVLLDKEKRAEYDQAQKEKLHGSRNRKEQRSEDQTSSEKEKSEEVTPDPFAEKEKAPQDIQYCLFCNSVLVAGVANAYSHPQLSNDECAVCKAPTKEVEEYQSSGENEIRTIERVAYDLATDVRLGPTSKDTVQMQMQNFSLKGASLTSPVDVKTRQKILILSNSVKAVGEVKYSQQSPDGGWKLGVEFSSLKLTMPKGELLSAKY